MYLTNGHGWLMQRTWAWHTQRTAGRHNVLQGDTSESIAESCVLVWYCATRVESEHE